MMKLYGANVLCTGTIYNGVLITEDHLLHSRVAIVQK